MPATSFYLRGNNLSGTNLTAEQSTSLPTGTDASNAWGIGPLNVTAGPGPGNNTSSRTSAATTAAQSGFLRAWGSAALEAQTIAAATWTFAGGFNESNAAANAFLALAVYIWRPSTSSKVDTIYDSATALGTEWPSSEAGIVATFSGSSVTTQSGDILVVEVWVVATQGGSMAYANSIYYEGSTRPTQGTATTNAASYIECPNTITFQGAVSINASVTDNSPAATDSSTATHIPPVSADVTDNNPAAADSVTASLSFDHTAAVTDNSPAATDASTVTHTAPTINADITDNNAAATDTATATHTASTDILATVTDNSPAAIDSSTVTQVAPTISGVVTDSNAAATDSVVVSQVAPTITGVITDNSPAATDVATVTHAIVSPISAVVTDNNAAAVDFITVLHAPIVEIIDHQWDGKILPTLNSTIVHNLTNGFDYKVTKIIRYNPKPPLKRYQYTCHVINITNNIPGRADVWYDELNSTWKCGEYDPVKFRDLDGVSKNL